ncbi:2'-5' RNA ligase family protein [Burkholderia sp. AU31624]|uniref:2'-5' RNA ligase family protein n=1 Tax=unclassified Burkholderia TaxID=2613784 RepID=UPI001CF577A9|nr:MULTISPECIES: 2'-5' RNA ligase family protein [unclassified Burkholderia]MCA8067771.1 2'-5' RNA ligase family protein [Burkholderia sp. AU38729]MCA8255586.1 2'-5' RNA ligase family protein [Burkholderia sp. AU31624]
MLTTAFVVEVPAAESTVADLRSRFDATSDPGVPAHVTVLFPFMPPDEITPDVLRQAQSALSVVQPFEFSLRKVERFAVTTYLAPDPPEPFVALTTARVERFPMFRAYGGAHDGMVPHLTVAHGDAATAHLVAVELEHRLSAREVIRTCCHSVALLENASGRWRKMHEIALPTVDV